MIRYYPDGTAFIRRDRYTPTGPKKVINDIRTGQPCTPATDVTSVTRIAWTNTTVGVSNPFYKSQIRTAQNATTPFHGFKRVVTRQAGNLGIIGIPHDYYCTGSLSSSGDIFPMQNHVAISLPNSEDAVNQALTGFVKKAQAELTPFMGGVVVGELRKTLSMVRSPFMTLRRELSSYFTQLEKVDRRLKRQQRRQILGNTYLEYHFGWLQLIRDTNDGLAALADVKPFDVKKISASGSRYTSGFGDLNSFSASGMQVSFRPMTIRAEQARVVGGIVTGFEHPGIGNTLGFTWPAFIPTAWELVPWSFLVDYFTNVGEIIGATAQVNGALGWASLTRRSKVTTLGIVEQVKVINPDGSYASGVSPGNVTLEDTTVDRTALGSVTPGFSWSMPNGGQFENITALLMQMRRLTPFF